MAKSDKRKKEQAAKRAGKLAAMGRPGGNSVYARKVRGIYPPNSPYHNVWRHFIVGAPKAKKTSVIEHDES